MCIGAPYIFGWLNFQPVINFDSVRGDASGYRVVMRLDVSTGGNAIYVYGGT